MDPGFREGRQFGRGRHGGQAGAEIAASGGFRGRGGRGGFRGRGGYRGRGRGGFRGGHRGGYNGGSSRGETSVYIPSKDPTFDAPTTFNPMAN